MANRVTKGTALIGGAKIKADGLQVGDQKVTAVKYIPFPLLAASVDNWVLVADRALRVVSIEEIHSVVGGASAAATFRKITDTSAPGAAASATVVELQQAAFDLTATINTTQTATLAADVADLTLADGDKIAVNFSGTLTGLVGMATIGVIPV